MGWTEMGGLMDWFHIWMAFGWMETNYWAGLVWVEVKRFGSVWFLVIDFWIQIGFSGNLKTTIELKYICLGFTHIITSKNFTRRFIHGDLYEFRTFIFRSNSFSLHMHFPPHIFIPNPWAIFRRCPSWALARVITKDMSPSTGGFS